MQTQYRWYRLAQRSNRAWSRNPSAARAPCRLAFRAEHPRRPPARRREKLLRAKSSRGRDCASARRTELPTELELRAAGRTPLHGEVLSAMRAERDATSLRERAATVPASARRDGSGHARGAPAACRTIAGRRRRIVLRGWRCRRARRWRRRCHCAHTHAGLRCYTRCRARRWWCGWARWWRRWGSAHRSHIVGFRLTR